MSDLSRKALVARPFALRGIINQMAKAFSVADQRHRLSQLDEKMLQDIGVSRSDALAEANRPFWDIPATRGC